MILPNKFETIEDFNSYFKNELVNLHYLEYIRWQRKITCPFCSHEKIYTLKKTNKGFNMYKCANQKCYKKFTITVQSLLTNTKLSLRTWLMSIFLFNKNNRELSLDDCLKYCHVENRETYLLINEKLTELFDGIPTLNPSYNSFELAVKNIFLKKDKIDYYKKENKTSRYHIEGINTIEDIGKNVPILKKYIHRCLYYKYRWIWIPTFMSSEEIISELINTLQQKRMFSFDCDIMIKELNNLIPKLFIDYCSHHPKIRQRFYQWQKQYYLEYRRRARKNLKKVYLIELAHRKTKLPRKEITKDKELLALTKQRIATQRLNKPTYYDPQPIRHL